MSTTDDIVTLLREDFCDFGQWENSCTPEGKCPCCLAADEIERLRWELELSNKWRDNYKLQVEYLQERLGIRG